MTVYYYIPTEQAEDVLSCGLKLSEHKDGEIVIDGKRKSFFFSYITPKDDPERYNGKSYICLKMDIPEEKLFVGEKIYLDSGKTEWFQQSVKPVKDYRVGEYRQPRFLITFTILGEQTGVLDKKRDIPSLYDHSEDMYFHCIRSHFEEKDRHFYDRSLLGYFHILHHLKLAVLEETKGEYLIYSHQGRKYILRKISDEA